MKILNVAAIAALMCTFALAILAALIPDLVASIAAEAPPLIALAFFAFVSAAVARACFSGRGIRYRAPAGALLAVALVAFAIGCNTLKDAGRTLNDAADIACELFAVDHRDELQGLSPRQWCDIKDHLDPFLEELLQAQREAGAKLGIQSPAPIGEDD